MTSSLELWPEDAVTGKWIEMHVIGEAAREEAQTLRVVLESGIPTKKAAEDPKPSTAVIQ
jgi:hypothetical protein